MHFFVLNYPPKNLLSSQLLSFPPTRKFLVCTLIMICFKQKIMRGFKIHQLIFCHLFCHFCFAVCKKVLMRKELNSHGSEPKYFLHFHDVWKSTKIFSFEFSRRKWRFTSKKQIFELSCQKNIILLLGNKHLNFRAKNGQHCSCWILAQKI